MCAFVFRRGAKGIEYLMLRRVPARGGFWQSVSGHVKRGEGAEEAAGREVREETGLEPTTTILLEKVNVFFKPGDETVYFEPCFGVEAPGTEPVLSHEHDAHRWAAFPDAMSLIPFRGVREALEELHRQLAGIPAGEMPPRA